MVPKLWARLRPDFVQVGFGTLRVELREELLFQVGELASLLLLHCISFPSGEEAFWRVVHRDFACADWKTRFDSGTETSDSFRVHKFAELFSRQGVCDGPCD